MEEVVGQSSPIHISPFNLLLRSDWHPGRIIHYQFYRISRCTISNPCNLSLNFSLLSERENYMHLKRCKLKTICYSMVHTIENCSALAFSSLECFSSQSWISMHTIILGSLKVKIRTLILSDLRQYHFKMHYLFSTNLFFSCNRFIVGNKNKQGHSCMMLFRNPLREAFKFLVYKLCFTHSHMIQLREAFCHNIIKVVSPKVSITV